MGKKTIKELEELTKQKKTWTTNDDLKRVIEAIYLLSQPYSPKIQAQDLGDVCASCESLKMRVIDFGAEMDELNKIRGYRDVTEMEMCKIIGLDWCMMDRESWIKLATQLYDMRTACREYFSTDKPPITFGKFIESLAKAMKVVIDDE